VHWNSSAYVIMTDFEKCREVVLHLLDRSVLRRGVLWRSVLRMVTPATTAAERLLSNLCVRSSQRTSEQPALRRKAINVLMC
jgi:hypothetical protein